MGISVCISTSNNKSLSKELRQVGKNIISQYNTFVLLLSSFVTNISFYFSFQALMPFQVRLTVERLTCEKKELEHQLFENRTK